MMNQYFEGAVSGCIHETDGTVAKYLGDAILAFWNAPDTQHDHALRACQAALLFRRQQDTSATYKGRTLVTRIGIHTGVANVGNFGSTQRVDYTCLGENVNLASRLEGLNKYLGTLTLLSGDTLARFQGKVRTRRVGRFRMKGFQKPVEVHELLDEPTGAEDADPAWQQTFEEALQCLVRKDWAGAEQGFRQTLDRKANDGPSRYYLGQLPQLRSKALPKDWQGEIELDEK